MACRCPSGCYHGGLPPALLAVAKRPAFYREWLDSFFARDIQRLFGFRDMNRFNAVFEYLLRQSGGQLEITTTARAVGITRPTVESHLRALEITHALTLVRPFHGGGQNEIVKQPKAYAFDTGFVSYARGWDPLRPDDLGPLWEHLVLEHLQAHCPDTPVRYWRDKQGREVDFVLAQRRDAVDAIECKWNPLPSTLPRPCGFFAAIIRRAATTWSLLGRSALRCAAWWPRRAGLHTYRSGSDSCCGNRG